MFVGKINKSTEGSVKVEQQYTHRFTDYNCCKLLTLSKSYKPVRTPEQRLGLSMWLTFIRLLCKAPDLPLGMLGL